MRFLSAAGSLAVATLAIVSPAAATTYHTIPQTVGLEFAADETFPTSTATRTAYITWDADWLYLAYAGEPSVPTPLPMRRMVWYFDTDPRPVPLSGAGTAAAVPLGTQHWTLPFYADYAFVAVTGVGSSLLYRWDGFAWVPSSGPWWTLGSGPTNPYEKFGIPRSQFGSPSSLYVLGFIVSSETGAESTYASWPNDSLVGGDGYQPAGVFAHWWGYTLGPGISPNDPAYHSLTLPVELMRFSVE